MALSDCIKCWQTPCECGYEFKNKSQSYKNTMTKSVNGFTIKDVFEWLSKKDYLSDNVDVIYNEFINQTKNKQ
jgi:hypothetical protein